MKTQLMAGFDVVINLKLKRFLIKAYFLLSGLNYSTFEGEMVEKMKIVLIGRLDSSGLTAPHDNTFGDLRRKRYFKSLMQCPGDPG